LRLLPIFKENDGGKTAVSRVSGDEARTGEQRDFLRGYVVHADQAFQLVVLYLGEGYGGGTGPLLGELLESGRYDSAGRTPLTR
jgi:hypothetical protein